MQGATNGNGVGSSLFLFKALIFYIFNAIAAIFLGLYGYLIRTKDNLKEKYQSVIDSLREERDELNVKMHLAGMEVRDEWHEVEKKWEHLQSKGKHLSKATGESAHEIGESFSVLGHELKETYQRLKRSL